MSDEKNIKRNRPSEEGRDNDPNIRDESALQPGISTVSPSNTDGANNKVTLSAMDGPELTDFDTDQNADANFDNVENKKNL
ncbi:MAG TPA: hypothetical protein VM010_05780 [Chitinophagaceae bacterium]|nr:hypothetical protein [Chitinophagaceae bacterium]